MKKKELLTSLVSAIVEEVDKKLVDVINVHLQPGETCPFCGRKKGKRTVTDKMLEANRRNAKKAREARGIDV